MFGSGIEHLINAFTLVTTPENLLACFFGCLLGTVVGVLPGLGPTATMSLFLPLTLKYGPMAGLIMMAGIWYGAQYGGSTTSILVNIPGEAASVVTCLDGYQMAKKGRAGAALTLAALGSFAAGTISIIGLQLFAPALAQAALSFGPPEYLFLMALTFVVLSSLTTGSVLKGLFMVALGLWVGIIGMDPIAGIPRFTLDNSELMAGIDFLPVAMGLFGIAEILTVAVKTYKPHLLTKVKLRDLYPTSKEMKQAVMPGIRGSIVGFFVGLLPGPAPTISTFVSYSLEKRVSKKPEEFGHGAIEGVVGPESANNAAVTGSMIPLLALGIPFAPPAAVLLAGLLMHNVQPGPLLIQENPQIFWGFVASMYIGNIMLLVLNLPLVGLFARIATLRTAFLMPIVAIICMVGAYSIRNSIFDIWIMLLTGIIGYLMNRWGFPVTPLVIGLVLGPMTENSFRQSFMMFKGQAHLFLGRPIAMALLIATIAFIIYIYRGREKIKKLVDEDN